MTEVEKRCEKETASSLSNSGLDRARETLMIETTKFALAQLGANFQEARRLLFTLQALVIGASPAILGLKRLEGLVFPYWPLYFSWGCALVGIGFLVNSYARAGETYKAQVISIFEVYGIEPNLFRAKTLSDFVTKETGKTKTVVCWAGHFFIASLAFLALFIFIALNGQVASHAP